MGISLKSATGKLRAFTSSVAADGSSFVPGPHGRIPGSTPWAAEGDQPREPVPRRNRARIDRAPVLDRFRIEELAGELQSRTSFLEFVNLFLVLLPHRVDYAVSALDGEDRETACAAVLSLASSAAITGGRRLELVACLIDDDLHAGRVNRARETGRRLVPDAAGLASALAPLVAGTLAAGSRTT
ncbi:hypothetical protein [Pseudarthrobacter sp. H2]|uniref:hypothetical protein n=1 Tax=Pseudarthrobacter sp. H2 TaxID=3418415 RepID=UPI003CE9A5EE